MRLRKGQKLKRKVCPRQTDQSVSSARHQHRNKWL